MMKDEQITYALQKVATAIKDLKQEFSVNDIQDKIAGLASIIEKNTNPTEDYNQTINNNQNTYVLFGKDSPFSSRLLLGLILTITVITLVLKYIPPYIQMRSELEKERRNYKLFYDYVYLSRYHNDKKSGKIIIDIKNDIDQGNQELIGEINSLRDYYKKEMKINALQAELKSLQ